MLSPASDQLCAVRHLLGGRRFLRGSADPRLRTRAASETAAHEATCVSRVGIALQVDRHCGWPDLAGEPVRARPLTPSGADPHRARGAARRRRDRLFAASRTGAGNELEHRRAHAGAIISWSATAPIARGAAPDLSWAAAVSCWGLRSALGHFAAIDRRHPRLPASATAIRTRIEDEAAASAIRR